MKSLLSFCLCLFFIFFSSIAYAEIVTTSTLDLVVQYNLAFEKKDFQTAFTIINQLFFKESTSVMFLRELAKCAGLLGKSQEYNDSMQALRFAKDPSAVEAFFHVLSFPNISPQLNSSLFLLFQGKNDLFVLQKWPKEAVLVGAAQKAKEMGSPHILSPVYEPSQTPVSLSSNKNPATNAQTARNGTNRETKTTEPLSKTEESELAVGMAAPNFSGISYFSKERIDLRDLIGKPIIFFTFTAESPTCKEAGKFLVGMKAKYPPLEVVAVVFEPGSYEDSAANHTKHLISWAVSSKLNFPVLLLDGGDDLLTQKYDCNFENCYFFIDRNGNIALIKNGFSLGERKELEDKIKELVK